ncbi:hypothetical protein UK23_40560 [Lentzea aerocolonigenes]|uniref:Uncharacterized protein n=1 Tax=Lentzea aerocolonigenes TaxID=68170 RepID=A0A0F0GIL0_LENAE|nr:hypothetical protein [Lentzea aerocolonigenes]KJK40108.1 hypothetical protein UK23_40560 [Lentzea aerocolonigenes]
MTANIIKTVKARIPVEFSQYVLFDYFGDDSVSDIERPANAGWVGCAGRGGAVFHASDQSIAAYIELQLWSGQPAADDLVDDLARFEGRFTADSGRVILASLTGSTSDVTVELPSAPGYGIRAIRLGSAVDEEDRQNEEWRLFVWPLSG